MTLQGRRRSDTNIDDLPDDIQPGDYWKVLNRETGLPFTVEEPTNLTGFIWMVAAPFTDTVFGVGNLIRHTVRENDDGTISVLPGDGSSNSILTTNKNYTYHGYIRNGVWD